MIKFLAGRRLISEPLVVKPPPRPSERRPVLVVWAAGRQDSAALHTSSEWGSRFSLPRQLTGHTTCRRSTISSVGRRGLVRRPLSIPFFTFLRASQPWGSLVLTTLFSRSSVLVMRPDTGHGRLSSIAGTTQCGVEGVETAVPPSHEDQGPTIFCYLEASETPHHQP